MCGRQQCDAPLEVRADLAPAGHSEAARAELLGHHVLVPVPGLLGAERRITYASSAAHYLRDAADGRRWDRKLPRHVVVVEALEVVDQIGGARAQHRYRYHDGSYDGRERHFRGFGFVEVQDDDPQAEAAEVARLTAVAAELTRRVELVAPASRAR